MSLVSELGVQRTQKYLFQSGTASYYMSGKGRKRKYQLNTVQDVFKELTENLVLYRLHFL